MKSWFQTAVREAGSTLKAQACKWDANVSTGGRQAGGCYWSACDARQKSGRLMSGTQWIYLEGIDCFELLAIGILMLEDNGR